MILEIACLRRYPFKQSNSAFPGSPGLYLSYTLIPQRN